MPADFSLAKARGADSENKYYTLQVYSEDCTGCGACVEICPVNRGKGDKQALIMSPNSDAKLHVENFENIPRIANKAEIANARDLQHIDPSFEFCSACAGCGEAPYLKILSQLYGDRLMLADACGCTLVYGGSLPTSPWTVNEEGRGPAFAASLFEDNAEFGYGIMLAAEKHRNQALELLERLASKINNSELIKTIQENQNKEAEIPAQRERVAKLKTILLNLNDPQAISLISLADHLVKHSVWAIGGDGWAYDIGYGGLDHVLASGRNIKVLVLDTEVYSNTGGQASKATPRGAVAKFAAQGKPTAKKDLGLMMMTYGNVYVASISLGSNPNQAIKAFKEAENYDGPALILAYSHCIAHGIEMHKGMQQQQLAVKCGYWPLYRYNPERAAQGLNPLQIDSEQPSISFSEFAKNENRYQVLARDNPAEAERLMKLAEEDIQRRWRLYNAYKN